MVEGRAIKAYPIINIYTYSKFTPVNIPHTELYISSEQIQPEEDRGGGSCDNAVSWEAAYSVGRVLRLT